ncbi:acetylxylan esterase [Chitinophaga sp.]|uniref:alpha/beta hydrolase family protein n=1 Tax=Chitinophaga sp. TaxID=1869181 RepID=UPI0031D0C229
MKLPFIILFLLTGMHLSAQQSDPIRHALEQQAAKAFHARTLPRSAAAWKQQRAALYQKIMRHSGAVTNHTLPPDMRETGRLNMQGYSIRSIYFQTRPGVYATASLYVPEGEGPFPAVVLTHGHWQGGRNSELFQSVAQQLAMHGYVCLSMDAWGAGERTTIHGEHEYHGSCLGASLMNVGTSLMGMQISDNIRAVDLLCTLPYVDVKRIGATGASGGGNQAMWLAAMDERIRAAIPVVSVGTFESYIMNSNCICELLPGGLTFTEEAGVLAMVAPRGLKIFNALKDNNRAFAPAQMQRSYAGAQQIFSLLKARDQLQHQLFDTTHGYWPEMQAAMLGWFDLQLKGQGNGAPVAIKPVAPQPEEKLMTFPAGKRDTLVVTTADYCRQQGLLLKRTFRPNDHEKQALREVLLLPAPGSIKKAVRTGSAGGWDSISITAANNEITYLLHRAPRNGSHSYIVVAGAAVPEDVDAGVVMLDLWGTGRGRSAAATAIDGKLPAFHTLSRSLLWLGSTVMGKWVDQLQLVNTWLHRQGATHISTSAAGEAGLAALFQAALYDNVQAVTLQNAPISYLFDNRAGVDHFNMAAHLPGILQWGDVSMAAALSSANITFEAPVSMSGRKITGTELEQYIQEFEKLKKKGTVKFLEKM